MKEVGAYEEMDRRPIWKRGPDYNYVHCNKVINPDYQKTYCILGYDQLKKRRKQLGKLYQDVTNDFVVLDNSVDVKKLCNTLDLYGLERMKCYSMSDCTKDELVRYFHLIYRSTEEFEIVEDGSPLFHKWNPNDANDAAAGLEAAAAAFKLTEEEQAKEEKEKRKALKKAARKANKSDEASDE
jgi:hypothetical protein